MLDQSHGVNNNRIEPLLTSHMTFKNHSMHLFPAVVSGKVEKTYPHSAEYPLPQLRGLPYGLLRGLPYRLPNGLPWINNQIYVYGGKRHKKLTCSTYTIITVSKTAVIFFSPTSSTQPSWSFLPHSPSATCQYLFLICFKCLPSTLTVALLACFWTFTLAGFRE